MGEHIIDHHTEKTKDSMQTLEEILYHLIDQAILITRHQEYQRVNVNLSVMSANIAKRGTILSTQLTHLCMLCATIFFPS